MIKNINLAMTNTKLLSFSQWGYFSLITIVLIWCIERYLSQTYSLLFCIIWLVPLLLPIRGILRGNPYTFAWTGFILCLYLLHSLTLLYLGKTPIFASIYTLVLISLLVSCSFYARRKGKELGLGLKNKKINKQDEN